MTAAKRRVTKPWLKMSPENIAALRYVSDLVPGIKLVEDNGVQHVVRYLLNLATYFETDEAKARSIKQIKTTRAWEEKRGIVRKRTTLIGE